MPIIEEGFRVSEIGRGERYDYRDRVEEAKSFYYREVIGKGRYFGWRKCPGHLLGPMMTWFIEDTTDRVIEMARKGERARIAAYIRERGCDYRQYRNECERRRARRGK